MGGLWEMQAWRGGREGNCCICAEQVAVNACMAILVKCAISAETEDS